MREATKAHKMAKKHEQRQIFTAACLFWKARRSKKSTADRQNPRTLLKFITFKKRNPQILPLKNQCYFLFSASSRSL